MGSGKTTAFLERMLLVLSWDNSLSLGVQLADRLRMKIIAGELADNQKISENQIANEYGSSRAPVREALRILENEGLVHLGKQGGVVKGLTEADLFEFYDVRYMLETFALTHLPQEEIPKLADQLEALSDRMELAITHRDFAEFAAQDMNFHNLVFASIQHRFVQLFWNNIRNLSQTVLYLGTKRRFEEQKYEKDLAGATNHRDIAKALRAGDPDQLRRALIMHFSYYNGWIMKEKFW